MNFNNKRIAEYARNEATILAIRISLYLTLVLTFVFMIGYYFHLKASSEDFLSNNIKNFSYWVQVGDQFQIERTVTNLSSSVKDMSVAVEVLGQGSFGNILQKPFFNKFIKSDLGYFYFESRDILDSSKKSIGRIFFYKNIPVSFGFYLFFILLITSASTSVFLFKRFRFFALKLTKPIFKIESELSDLNEPERMLSLASDPDDFFEIQHLRDTLSKMALRIQDQHLEIKAKDLLLEREEMALQVAHDIRSPLTALDTILRDIEQFPMSKRSMIRSAVQRIHDIANNLLTENRQTPFNKEIQPYLVFELIDSLVTEKRYQFMNRDVEIETNFDNLINSRFISVEITEFRNVVSNILNNAIEAMDYKGKVQILIHFSDTHLILEVADSGKGISNTFIDKVFEKGASSGKENGNGLGLYHAKKMIEKWGGGISISSRENEGTKVNFKLPLSSKPDWFCDTITIYNTSKLVFCDDDDSIHHLWNQKCNSLDSNCQIYSFHSFEQLIDYENINGRFKDSIIFLDNEYGTSPLRGIDLVNLIDSSCSVYLVTSHFSDKDIQSKCIEQGIKLIPKNILPYLSFHLSKDSDLHVLIDDDKFIRYNWKQRAIEKNIALEVFADPASFMSQISRFNHDTKFFIDSDLKASESGEQLALDLHNRGFKFITMATGHSRSRFSHLTFLVDVVGKQPPF